MAFTSKLRDCTYKAPSGATFALQFEDVERSGGKKAAVHEHPQQNGATVQDLGNVSETFPMAVFFSGDQAAARGDAFFAALGEKGPASLKHPRWGDLRVLPISWTQGERYVEGLGRVSFQIDFIRVLEQAAFPISSVAIEEAVSSITGTASASSDSYAAGLFSPENAADVARIVESSVEQVLAFGDTMAEVVSGSYEAAADLSKMVRDFEFRAEQLITQPLALFQLITEIAQIPASVPGRIRDKIEGYAAQIERTASAVPESYAQADANVQAIVAYFAGATQASTVGTIKSRQEAVVLADGLASIAAAAQAGAERNEAAVPEYRPPVEVLADLAEAAALARDSLLERAYNLPSERLAVLAVERTPLDFLFEVYGDIDRLDEFIDTNDLQGDSIVMMPAGLEVVYYA